MHVNGGAIRCQLLCGAPWRRPVRRRAMPRFKECNATLSSVLEWINDAPPHNCGAIGQPSHTTSSFLELQLLLTTRPRHGLTGLEIELFRAVQAVIGVNLAMQVDEECASAPLNELAHES